MKQHLVYLFLLITLLFGSCSNPSDAAAEKCIKGLVTNMNKKEATECFGNTTLNGKTVFSMEDLKVNKLKVKSLEKDGKIWKAVTEMNVTANVNFNKELNSWPYVEATPGGSQTFDVNYSFDMYKTDKGDWGVTTKGIYYTESNGIIHK